MVLRCCRGLLAGGFFLGLFFTSTFADVGEAYYGFLEEPVNSRLMGMGSVGTSIAGGGFSFYNPASASLRTPSVSLDFGKLYEDLRRGAFEIGYGFDTWFIGAAIQSQSIDFQFSSEQGVIDGVTGTAQGVMGSLAVGLIRGDFSFGIALNGIQDRIVEEKSYGVTGSIGAMYAVIPENLQAGASVLHLAGRGTLHSDTTRNLQKLIFPTTIRAGLSYHDSLAEKMVYTASADFVYSFNYRRVMVPIGMELWVLPPLAIRLGARLNHPSDLFTMGIGVKLENLNYNAAFIPMRYDDEYSIKWTMGLTYELPQPKKRKSGITVQDTGKTDSTVQSDTGEIKTDTNSIKTSDENSILEEKHEIAPLDTLQSTEADTSVSNEAVIDSSSGNTALPEVNSSTKDESGGNAVDNTAVPDAVPADTTGGSKPQ
ncbi:MAG: hypothetical protein GX640_23005 [Fibrobacter sp.]|nr:hypothetical protein [Fibrobacter sp.]